MKCKGTGLSGSGSLLPGTSYHRLGVKGLSSEVPTNWFASGSLQTQNFPLMRFSSNMGKGEGMEEAHQK